MTAFDGTPNDFIRLDNEQRAALETYQIHQELRMYNNINSQSEFWQWYQIYLWQEKHFTNFINWDTADKDFAKLRPALMYIAWTYGKAAIKKLSNGEYKVLTVVKPKYDANGWLIGGYGQVISKEGMSSTLIKLNKDDTAFFQWGYRGWPALLIWRDFCNNVCTMFDVARTNSLMKTSKMIYHMNDGNSEVSQFEISQMLNPKLPYVPLVGNSNMAFRYGKTENEKAADGYAGSTGTTGTQNKIEVLSTPISEDIYTDLQEYMAIHYYHQGRKFNSNYKKERMITGEMDMEEDNYDIVNRDIFEYHEDFLEQCRTKFGVEIEMVSLVEKEQEQQVDEERLGE